MSSYFNKGCECRETNGVSFDHSEVNYRRRWSALESDFNSTCSCQALLTLSRDQCSTVWTTLIMALSRWSWFHGILLGFADLIHRALLRSEGVFSSSNLYSGRRNNLYQTRNVQSNKAGQVNSGGVLQMPTANLCGGKQFAPTNSFANSPLFANFVSLQRTIVDRDGSSLRTYWYGVF